MKVKRLGIGILLVALPLLLAQMILRKEDQIILPRQSPASDSTSTTSVTVPANPELQKFLVKYEKEIQALLKASNTPGAAIAVVKDSNIIYMRGFGVRKIGGKDSVDTRTVFRLASVSKCFASFLTGILVSDSVLSWNDHVVEYLPSFALKSPEQTQKLTLQHILSHTTGLPYHTYTNMVEEGLELSALLEKLKEVNMSNEVGKEYSYQNVAYSVIGEVIKKATGKTYEAEMLDKVFTPLHMENASTDYQTLMGNPNIAQPHRLRKGRWVTAPITNTYYNVAPAGGINASIHDMANWMIALLGNREDVIDPGMLKELYSPHIKAPSKNRNYGRTERISSSYYGLGWRVLHYPNDTLIYHGGYVNGFRSEVAVNTKDHIAICLLTNAPGMAADKGVPLFFNLFKAQRDSIAAWDNQQVNLLQEQLTNP